MLTLIKEKCLSTLYSIFGTLQLQRKCLNNQTCITNVWSVGTPPPVTSIMGDNPVFPAESFFEDAFWDLWSMPVSWPTMPKIVTSFSRRVQLVSTAGFVNVCPSVWIRNLWRSTDRRGLRSKISWMRETTLLHPWYRFIVWKGLLIVSD